MGKHVCIVGGGIVGLSCAYYLMKEGNKVTVIDKSNMDAGASYVNAGYLTPSHIIPLASPGMMAKGLKWMFNSSSPFYMKPQLNIDFLKWVWYFNKSSTRANIERAIPLIRDINLLSKDLYTEMHYSQELGAFQLEKKGLLMLYKTKKAGTGEREVAKRAIDIGLDVELPSYGQLQQLQPHLNPEVLGAVHYTCDAHTTPPQFMEKLKAFLIDNGVEIRTNEPVSEFKQKGKTILEIQTPIQTHPFDELVLASGAWTSLLAKKLGIRLLLQAGKGYRINVHRKTPVNLPAVLMEAKVAVTPMLGFTRFAGTMEFSGINAKIRKERVHAIANAAARYYTNLRISQEERNSAQCGLRPVSPDGMPYIGRTSKYNNLTIATGHAMMGWSLGPATGKLVSEIITEKALSMPIEGFHPERKF